MEKTPTTKAEKYANSAQTYEGGAGRIKKKMYKNQQGIN
jgi:hypothetical protein